MKNRLINLQLKFLRLTLYRLNNNRHIAKIL